MASKSTYNRPASKKPSKPSKPSAPLYSWQGGPKTHTIPYAQHVENTKVKQYGLTPGQGLDAPISPIQAINYAEAAAGRQYDPQIQQNAAMQTALPAWYQNYVNESIGRQQAVQSAAQTLLAPTAQAAQAAPQAAPGLDPSSPEYARSLQAGQAIQGQNQASYNALAAVPLAAIGYLAGAQDVARRDQPGAMNYLGQKGADLKSQKGEYATEKLGELRTNAQNYGIAQATLGLNTAKSKADIDLQRGIDPVTGKPLPSDPEKPITSGPFAGLTGSQVTGLSSQDRQTYIDNYNSAVHPPKTPKDPNAPTPSEQRAETRRKEKHQAAVQAATGKVRNKIEDIRKAWAQGGTVDVKDQFGQVTGTRKATRAELRAALSGKYGAKWVEIMETIRDGKKLTQDQIDYLHNSDKNLRIPREWLPSKGGGISRPGNAPAGPGSSEQRPT